jgi:hypothetical protein
VEVPEQVILVCLPASRPALTPVERLWEALQDRSAVRKGPGRSRLRALQEHVAGLVQRSSAAMIASLTGYASLGEAVYAL